MEGRDFAPLVGSRSVAELARSRIVSLMTATPSRTTSELTWLHHALFVGIDPSAGQLRSEPLTWKGICLARPDLIQASLDDRFGELLASNAFQDLKFDDFLDRLAFHVSELHAISPFAIGNRRLIGLHAAQIAHSAGHEISLFAAPKSDWDFALYQSLIERETAPIAALLRGVFDAEDNRKQDRAGPAGIALLPARTTPRARRYLKSMKNARLELEAMLPDAIRTAKAMLARLERGVVPGGDPVALSQRLSCLEHQRGPLFMADLLDAARVHKIEGVFSDGQSALERVNEITAAMIMAINMLPAEVIDDAAGQLAVARYPIGGSPHQDRLAEQFLRNSALTNRLDPRFAPAQRYVDAIAAESRELAGRQAAEIEIIVEQRRHYAADRIRAGDMLMGGDVPATTKSLSPMKASVRRER